MTITWMIAQRSFYFILLVSEALVMGTRILSSIVPDFLIPSPGFFLLLRTMKGLTFWSYLQATYNFATRHSPCQKYSLYLLVSPEGQLFRVAGWWMMQNSHRFWGCETTEELESLVVSIILLSWATNK